MSLDRLRSAFAANELAPLARDEERRALIDALQLRSDAHVLEVGGWDGYLAAALVGHDLTIVERLPHFAAELRRRLPTVTVRDGLHERLPVDDAAFSHVAALVSLHHVDARGFLREANRVLVDGGRLVVVEVPLGGPVAHFLEQEVARLTRRGHAGNYWPDQQWIDEARAAGFADATATVVNSRWRFAAMSQAIEFCRAVFGLDAADAQILDAIHTLSPVPDDNGISWAWPLLVTTGTARS